MALYRTRTYIAADFDEDIDAVEQLHKWKEGKKWSLSFTDAHDLQNSRDDSKPCSIKASLKLRMDGSKRFVLIVGEHTKNLTKGSCAWCDSYNHHTYACAKQKSVDHRSFIKYECDEAVKSIDDGMSIIVLYKATKVDKSKCPDAIKNLGNHVSMIYKGDDGKLYWDYNSVRDAFGM